MNCLQNKDEINQQHRLGHTEKELSDTEFIFPAEIIRVPSSEESIELRKHLHVHSQQ